MSVTAALRDKVRVRANYVCEYCGVSEIDSAGPLTIDHVIPKVAGGADTEDNLVYCCHSCNEFKSSYVANSLEKIPLWNPRRELEETHFLELADGRLYPITDIGTFTLHRLRLNRLQLIAYRLKVRREQNEERMLTFYRDLLGTLENLQQSQMILVEDRQHLLRVLARVIALIEKHEP